jgi:hypothetical protein
MGDVSPSAQPEIITGSTPAVDTISGDDDEAELEADGERARLHCASGGEVDLQADRVRLRVTGHCDQVSIDGSGNVVDIEDTAELSVDGAANSVSAVSAGDVDLDGAGQTVAVGLITEELHVEGHDNRVRYGGSPTHESSGRNDVSPFEH